MVTLLKEIGLKESFKASENISASWVLMKEIGNKINLMEMELRHGKMALSIKAAIN